MTKIVDTYMLDGNNTTNIPLPHDCEIKDIREDNDYLMSGWPFADQSDTEQRRGTIPAAIKEEPKKWNTKWRI